MNRRQFEFDLSAPSIATSIKVKYQFLFLSFFFLFVGEVDVKNMYVDDGSEGSLDVETASDDKYATAVESIDIPRKGSYI